MESKYDDELLRLCKTQIEDTLNWGKPEDWRNAEFRELSSLIEKKTGVNLSETTLKRIWKRVSSDHQPATTTLDALARFIERESWRAFRLEHQNGYTKQGNGRKIKWRNSSYTKILIIALLFLGTFTAYTFLSSKTRGIDKQTRESISFAGDVVAKGLPNTVLFKFDLAEVKSDRLKIQLFWDKTKTVDLTNGQTEAAGVYYFPGYYHAQLIIDDEAIRDHDVFIKSEGWLTTVDKNPHPIYVGSPLPNPTKLQVPTAVSDELNSSSELNYLTYHYVDEFENLHSDNFSLETNFRNTYKGNVDRCKTVKIILLGTTGAMIIPFSIPGCVGDLNIMLNDLYLPGASNDLSQLGIEGDGMQKLNVKVVDKEVRIMLNDKIVFQGSYNKSAGDIAGMRISFLGTGEVGNTVFTNVDNEHFYIVGEESSD